MPGRARQAEDTRRRILEIAGDLFAAQGYNGTSIADITGRLGTTTAALYYHFKSKAEILDELLRDSMAAYAQLVDEAPDAEPEELLGTVIDMIAKSHKLMPIVSNDPAVRSMLD